MNGFRGCKTDKKKSKVKARTLVSCEVKLNHALVPTEEYLPDQFISRSELSFRYIKPFRT